jgi:hypothetical protein
MNWISRLSSLSVTYRSISSTRILSQRDPMKDMSPEELKEAKRQVIIFLFNKRCCEEDGEHMLLVGLE